MKKIKLRDWLLFGAGLMALLSLTISVRDAASDETPAFRQAAPVSVPIVMYHSILNDPAASGAYVISPDLFRSDLLYLKEHGYTTVLTSDLVAYAYDGVPLPEKPVLVTLDDGYLNNATYVLPILEELDMKAIISVVGAYSERYTDEPDPRPSYAYLTWQDIAALSASGHVEIGNHTFAMHQIGARRGCQRMKGVSAETYCSVLRADLEKLQTVLAEQAGVTPIVFAYPYGLCSAECVDVLKELGILAALTCEETINALTGDPEELYHLGRFNRPAGITTEAFMKRVGIG